jgi:drug/metabolite transporter (DMT)-like permease
VPGPAAAVGVVLVAGGVMAVRGLHRPQHALDVGLALAVGVTIAGYTLIDKHGIVHASAPVYFELALLPSAVACLAWAWHSGRLRGELRPQALVAGAGMFAAYALVLVALRLASAAAVAAVRETSVVFAAGMAAVRLHEPVGRARAVGAAAVAAGVALIALG